VICAHSLTCSPLATPRTPYAHAGATKASALLALRDVSRRRSRLASLSGLYLRNPFTLGFSSTRSRRSGAEYTANEPRRHIAEQLDGSYVLKTDRSDLSADEAWRIYTLLSRAENAFRSMKSPLAERPIFHQIERRVETHIFLCVLAYHLLVAIEKTLLDQGVHTSWATVRETLKTHQVCTVVLPTDRGSVLRIRQGSTPEPEHKALYKRLKVPEQIIRAKKIWSDQAAD